MGLSCTGQFMTPVLAGHHAGCLVKRFNGAKFTDHESSIGQAVSVWKDVDLDRVDLANKFNFISSVMDVSMGMF